ncbi:MAG: CerR family C-terminal domain-containing protein, partial [Planctomycetota bacterium]
TDNKRVEERLLDAAEELFCEHGFAGTSVRDLAAAAKCNIAAVNYYFGGKENLYAEVWRRLLVRMRQVRLESIEQVMGERGGRPSLDELLRTFSYAFIGPLLEQDKSGLFMKLWAREMLDQHLPTNMFVEELVTPTMTAMGQALVDVCPGLDKSKIPLVIYSLAGQLAHSVHVKAMFDRTDKPEVPKLDLAELVEHIVKFSAAGIRAYAGGKGQ